MSMRRPFLHGLILAAASALPFAGAAPALAEGLYVAVDEAEILKLDAPAAEIIIGNPAYAAISVQSNDTLVVTGKAYGQTNIIVLDAKGREILNDRLTVVGTRRAVTVTKGSERFSYLCSPVCRMAPQLGDQSDYFDGALKQVQTRNGLAEAGAQASGGQ
jgi:hypothetical protein